MEAGVATWSEFSDRAPDLAESGRRLIDEYHVAFLATVRHDGAPRLHPVTPVIADGRLFVFVPPTSPKHGDLVRDGRYALHAPLGKDDEEFVVNGAARRRDDAAVYATVVAAASYTVAHGEDLFELDIERCLWGYWENVGQPDTRPIRRSWRAPTSG
jgi:hypothetical protein